MKKLWQNPFVHPSPDEMKAQQLAESERELVDALYTLEHYESRVELLEKRIKRLKGNHE